MAQYLIPLVLIAGLIIAWYATRWINWFTFGENRYKKEQMEMRKKLRAEMRKDKDGSEK